MRVFVCFVVGRALQQFETFHDGDIVKLHQFEVMQIANLMQADSEVEEVRCSFVACWLEGF